jgi:hypothetical protein
MPVREEIPMTEHDTLGRAFGSRREEDDSGVVR